MAVEVELLGIPAHAWELATTEQLLNDFCWIGGLHPDNQDRRDVFRLAAWCSSLDSIPGGLDLEIIEPQVAGDEAIQAKRALVYPIEVSVVAADHHHSSSDPVLSASG